MKALLITTLVMGFISVNSVFAAQEINHADGKEKLAKSQPTMPIPLMSYQMHSLVRLMSKEQHHSKFCQPRGITGCTGLQRSINK